MSENVTILTDSSFESEVLKSEIPVLVDFWAEWCGPCKLVGPIVEELAIDFEGKIKFCKHDTDEHTKNAATYGISAIPTLIMFKDGHEADRMVGAKSKKDIKSMLEQHL